jgi:hypothetical protein
MPSQTKNLMNLAIGNVKDVSTVTTNAPTRT